MKEPGRDKGSSRWKEGHFLGVPNETGELLIGNEEGVVKARDFKRMAEEKVRWNATSLKGMRGSPWKPNPEVEDHEVHVQVRIPREEEPVTSAFQGAALEPQVRRSRISPELVKKLGLLSDCLGCQSIKNKEPTSRNHSEACRLRVDKYWGEQGLGSKVEQQYRRIGEHFERQQKTNQEEAAQEAASSKKKEKQTRINNKLKKARRSRRAPG